MPNRLAFESSLYLKQHADNPVDWFPWGEEALQRARIEDKPILLSIGYSACHWCHVMAHESFEDPEVAAIMNRLFVNIKVDREERPDLDQIYQNAHYLLTERSGGWPLTMFLMPDQIPFFGGTYFPKNSRYDLPGFKDILPRVADFYRERRGEVEQQNLALAQALRHTLPAAADDLERNEAPITAAAGQLLRTVDAEYGGLGSAPKFPHPWEMGFLLRRHAATGDEKTLHAARLTLEKMALGGIYDHLGGGFCRYSVDRYWSIPHFEKMLYDNGPLLWLYSDAWLVTGNPLFKEIVEETAAWVMREMQSPEGGYYSTLDADSEHEEGKFYIWTPQEARALLTVEEYGLFAARYGLDGAPNFENKHWHLNVRKGLEELAAEHDKTVDQCRRLLSSARGKLFVAREKRVRPGRDEKILTSWNGLMIKGLARAARVFDRSEWLDSAQRAADFVRATLWRDGRLYVTHKDNKTHLNAYLDDHAFLLDGLLELAQAEWRDHDLEFAKNLADVLLQKFEDAEQGGFFFTSHDHEKLIHRPKPGYDNATPSGNGIAAFALNRLGHMLAETRYTAAAERTLNLFLSLLRDHAAAFTTLLSALEEVLAPPRIVVLRGEKSALRDWARSLAGRYMPDTVVLSLAGNVTGLPAVLDRGPGAPVNAWVCQGAACLPPIADLPQLLEVCKRRELG